MNTLAVTSRPDGGRRPFPFWDRLLGLRKRGLPVSFVFRPFMIMADLSPRPTKDSKLISRRRFLQLASGGIVALGGVSWHSWLFSPTHPVITHEEVALKDLPAAFHGLRIVQLSDLHFSGLVPEAYLAKCVELANALKPDLLFLTGDFVTMEGWSRRADTTRNYIEPLPGILHKLHGRFGRFAVLGNHDVTVNPRAVTAALEEAGIRVLRDERVALSRNRQRLPVVGLADFGTQAVNQERAFAGIAPDEPALIMMHNPDLFGVGMAHRNGLIFAGHTHGGQVRIPFMGPLYVPSRFGARYLSGRFQEGELCMLVNRGVGVIRYRVRLNCRPEITLVTLRGK